MATVMNMSGYEVERPEESVDDYSDEVMASGWNPQLSLMSICANTREAKNRFMPESLRDVDVDAFLKMMYVSQR
ncbi:MAG: hypothetical protein PHP57_10830 [Sideroxydans sp.]|nr:hypothetical protein [Sideroxydans sp.]